MSMERYLSCCDMGIKNLSVPRVHASTVPSLCIHVVAFIIIISTPEFGLLIVSKFRHPVLIHVEVLDFDWPSHE